MKYQDRREMIVRAGLLAAQQVGYQNLTRRIVARRAETSSSLIQFHFNTMEELRSAIVRQAIEDENLQVVAQALGVLHDDAVAAPEAVKTKAIAYLKEASRAHARV